MLSQKDLLSEFLFDRVALSSILPFERFKRLFPKGSSEATIRDIYNHLKKQDNTTRRTLKKSLDNNPFFDENTQRASGTQDIDSIEKLNTNLEALTSILNIELMKLSDEYRIELESLEREVMELNDITFGKSSEELNSSIEELSEAIRTLQE